MMKRAFLILSLILVASCSSQRKIASVRKEAMGTKMEIPSEIYVPELDLDSASSPDTMYVENPEGEKVLIMKAVKDVDGELAVTDVIQAAVVTAKFRNVAERHGKVDLKFRITVPREMQDGKWQLRLSPELYILSDTTVLDGITVTGSAYRKAQLRGYQHYRKFLESIITDSTAFIDKYQLEMFLRRNLPSLYSFRTDSTFVSDEQFASAYGVTEQAAVEHYTNKLMVRRNQWKIEHKDEMFGRYVKVPLVTEGLRLDTLIADASGDLIYDYVQTIPVRSGLKKAEITLGGNIYEQDRCIYDIPRSEPLTFYISSVSTLADQSVRYKTMVLERRVEANTACYVEFASGRAEIDMTLGNNSEEIGRIEGNLTSLMENEVFDLDSIVVTASCSPEGSWEQNSRLSKMRSRSVSSYFERYMKNWRDTSGFAVGEDGRATMADISSIRFVSRNNPENWSMLDALVSSDECLSPKDRSEYTLAQAASTPDLRESMMKKMSSYSYLRSHLYPRLRTVKFDFFLHRKGLVKDTVHTTVIDTAYMMGVKALIDRDYETAVTLLRPYSDFNCAVAYCAMDYNASALSVLENLPSSGKRDYLLSLVYSRTGQERKAVEAYMRACKESRSFIHRGNLDPEISALVEKYRLEL